MAFKVNETVIKLEGKKIPKYGGKKKTARKLKHWKTPLTEPSLSYSDRQEKPTEWKYLELARTDCVESKPLMWS